VGLLVPMQPMDFQSIVVELYMGISESQIVNIIMGPILLIGAYFFIKKGQTI